VQAVRGEGIVSERNKRSGERLADSAGENTLSLVYRAGTEAGPQTANQGRYGVLLQYDLILARLDCRRNCGRQRLGDGLLRHIERADLRHVARIRIAVAGRSRASNSRVQPRVRSRLNGLQASGVYDRDLAHTGPVPA